MVESAYRYDDGRTTGRSHSWTRLHHATVAALSMSSIRSGPVAHENGGSRGQINESAALSSTETSRQSSPIHSRSSTPAVSRANSVYELNINSRPQNCSATSSGALSPSTGFDQQVGFSQEVSIVFDPPLEYSTTEHRPDGRLSWPFIDGSIPPAAFGHSLEASSSTKGARTQGRYRNETTTYTLDCQDITCTNDRLPQAQLDAWGVEIDRAHVTRLIARDGTCGLARRLWLRRWDK
ncbi:hypothetical protein PYCC9005_001928 [Savitreella phatthalungensis]